MSFAVYSNDFHIGILHRERYEVMIDKELGCGDINLTGHHQSRDSAIDTEVQECEMEICEIDLVSTLWCYVLM